MTWHETRRALRPRTTSPVTPHADFSSSSSQSVDGAPADLRPFTLYPVLDRERGPTRSVVLVPFAPLAA
jgi:hypothetical protein